MPTPPTFDERFDTLAALAYRVAYRLVGDRHEAENISQECLARAYVRWRRIHAYDEAWVTRVSTNLAIGHWRKHGRDHALSRVEPAYAASSIERIDIARALRTLPKRQREVLALRYLADMTESATAEQLGCSIGTVKQHASRGLRAMRSTLDDTSSAEDLTVGLTRAHLEPTTGTEPC